MSVFDDRYVFRFARKDDIRSIMNFIKEFWSESHIFAMDEEFFKYEFVQDEDVHFFLAINKKSGAWDGVCAFYLYEQTGTIGDYSGAIWKISPNCKTPMLGVEIAKRLFSSLNARASLGNGAKMATAVALERDTLSHFTGRLRHFYRLSDRSNYNVAEIKNRVIPQIKTVQNVNFVKYTNFKDYKKGFVDVLGKTRIPYKDDWYVEKRYFQHPIYNYQLYGIGDRCVMVGRELAVNGRKIFRIVDLLGIPEKIVEAGLSIQRLLDENDYEYVDIYEYGVDEKVFTDIGFVERLENDVNVIPNYFEPFERKNIEIYYGISRSDVYLFKADGDQDRPNHR